MDVVAPTENIRAQAPSLADYDYVLPPELIAQFPAPARDGARLLVLGRAKGTLRHEVVGNLPALLRAGDLLVLNDTRVCPARLFGRTASGGAIELLLVAETRKDRWQCLGRPAKRLRLGAQVHLPGGARARVSEVRGEGRYTVAFAPSKDVPQLLSEHGEIPLPPYIKRPDGPLAVDRERYQTVFAARGASVAAPTAGLHFTSPLLGSLRGAGVDLAWLTLDIGPATFMPIRGENLDAYRMEPEWATIPAATVEAVRRAKAAGRRVVAVGTTTTRALESAAARPEGLTAGGVWADKFIFPGFCFRVVDALLTNFHLPKSTLLMLVSAFAGRRAIRAAYATAVRERYRFYSYGDAMLIG